jgi:hypothetical protein
MRLFLKVFAATAIALPATAMACDLEAGGYGRFSAFSSFAHQQAPADAMSAEPTTAQADSNRSSASVKQDVEAEPASAPADTQSLQSDSRPSDAARSEGATARSPVTVEEQASNSDAESAYGLRMTS